MWRGVVVPGQSTENTVADAIFSPRAALEYLRSWLSDKLSLVEAFFVAVTFHVLLIPVIWFMGWALPWPKTPVITTVIEIDLTDWPRVAKPGKVTKIFTNDLNK